MLELPRNSELILGSGSPRRLELLKQLKIPFRIEVSDLDEKYPSDLPNEEIPGFLAELKATHLLERVSPNDILITCDTLVFNHSEVLGKPKDKDQAIEMLMSLSCKEHRVITAITMTYMNTMHTKSDCTTVFFEEIKEKEAVWYVDNFEVLDKAGAYGVQDWIGLCKVNKIIGSYYNIMGLPMHLLYKMLQKV